VSTHVPWPYADYTLTIQLKRTPSSQKLHVVCYDRHRWSTQERLCFHDVLGSRPPVHELAAVCDSVEKVVFRALSDFAPWGAELELGDGQSDELGRLPTERP
jgi:hypothetical protein